MLSNREKSVKFVEARDSKADDDYRLLNYIELIDSTVDGFNFVRTRYL